MQLREIMTLDVAVTRPDATLAEAAEQMKALDVGLLPVCDGDYLVGMLTDRDITVRAAAAGSDPTTTLVVDTMTPDVVSCYADQEVEEAARVMQQKQIRRLLVLDRDQRLVGIVSLGDLALQTGDQQLAGEVVERVSEPSAPKPA
jgi:CBS domain-containing protein